MKTYKFNKVDMIECKMTTLIEVSASSLTVAKSLILNGKGEQVGLMFTDADILEEGEVKYVKDR
ncbi:MAG: hypothetical protein HON83_02995 [Candidatus Marinimicrobia bacterium]|jgi:hypothetical protein|nr:hypothetical protein [Candidatus Neomarinimicrobiota bacterium]MBT5235909.1 hypothetical protein [Candidatus Neomarinimicrobiota bacterium]